MDDEIRYIPRSGPMFSGGSVAKADMATNLAIPLLAEGGWSALTLRNVARASNVTPQAIAAWFPSVDAMRAAVAGRYGQRWIRERGFVARRRILQWQIAEQSVSLPQVALSLLPQTWLEQVYDGVWLTLVEAARWGEALSREVSTIEEAERDLVADLLHDLGECDADRLERHVDLVLGFVRGMRMALTSPRDPMSPERAAEVLVDSLSGVR